MLEEEARNSSRHNLARAELIRLHEIITKRHFSVIAPRSAFLSTDQLEQLERNPPVGGIGMFSRPKEFRVTIEKIMRAYSLGGDDFELGFGRPSKDIPVIYETIQEYIRNWVYLKLNSWGHDLPSVEELREMERVPRSIYSAYHYYYKEAYRKSHRKARDEYSRDITKLYMDMLVNGKDGPDDISFISYVDIYQESSDAREKELSGYFNMNMFAQEPVEKPKMFEVAKQHKLIEELPQRD